MCFGFILSLCYLRWNIRQMRILHQMTCLVIHFSILVYMDLVHLLIFTIPQTCVKYCTQEERDSIFDALRPHLLTLSCKKYAVHLVKKILDHGIFPNSWVVDVSFMQVFCKVE